MGVLRKALGVLTLTCVLGWAGAEPGWSATPAPAPTPGAGVVLSASQLTVGMGMAVDISNNNQPMISNRPATGFGYADTTFVYGVGGPLVLLTKPMSYEACAGPGNTSARSITYKPAIQAGNTFCVQGYNVLAGVRVLRVASDPSHAITVEMTVWGSPPTRTEAHYGPFSRTTMLVLLSALLVLLIGFLVALGVVTLRGARVEKQREDAARVQLDNAEAALNVVISTQGDVVVTGPGGQAGEAPDEERQLLGLTTLWTVTHKRLDLYHAIATGQARRSFRNAQIAISVGFTLLVGFAVLTAVTKDTATSVVIGGLGAVSAAFAGYIGRTFVKSQETAASHLRTYFDQPLEFARFLAAERLLTNVRLTDEQHAAVVSTLAQSIAGLAPPANGE